MSQFANPISQDSNVGWSPDPVTPNVAKPGPAEAPFATSGPDPVEDTFQVKLGLLAEPGSGTGTLRVQHRLNGPATNRTLYLALRQGSTLIASKLVSPAAASSVETMTISQDQMDMIDNFNDLHVQVTASGPCCDNGIPTTMPVRIVFTFSDETFSGNIDFNTVYDAASKRWIGAGTCGTSTIQTQMWCAQPAPTSVDFLCEVSCNGSLMARFRIQLPCQSSDGAIYGTGGTPVPEDDGDVIDNEPFLCCGKLVAAINFMTDSRGF